MNNTAWSPASEKDVQNYLYEIKKMIPEAQSSLIVYLSYLLYLQKKMYQGNKMPLSQILAKKFGGMETDLEYILRDYVEEPLWDRVKPISPSVSFSVLDTVILDTTGEYLRTSGRREDDFGLSYTPEGLSELVLHLLDIKSGETVCDICGGIGNFILSALKTEPHAFYESIELNPQAAAVMQIRSDILNCKNTEAEIHTEVGNVLRLTDDREENVTDKYDKVFGNYPWMLNIEREQWLDSSAFLTYAEQTIPGIVRQNSSDWLFNLRMTSMLKPGGKAVGIMTPGSTWNMVSVISGARKYFLQHGLIEAVIALPSCVFSWTAISPVLIVLSHGNDHVRMVDASAICTEKKRLNTFTSENIQTILDALVHDGEHSISVSNQDILNREGAVIHPKRYLEKSVSVKEGKPLGSVLKDICRGALMSASELDTLQTDTPSDIQYVMVKDINDGIIGEDLPYLSRLPEKYEKSLIPHHGIILSKMGIPFKCAVAEIEPHHRLLASSNMYILKADETKVNPYYLQAFFESDLGASLLSSICNGTMVPTFSKKSLENLVIPLPPLEKQKKIVERYLAIQDEIQIYKRKLRRASERKAHILDDMQEE